MLASDTTYLLEPDTLQPRETAGTSVVDLLSYTHTRLSPKPLHMTHNQTVDQDVTRQAVEELLISPGAARKNSRVRQLCSAQMLAFMWTAVPGEEPMSVYMFS